ncbi:MAG TPA: alpha/beta fold hydrolase [Chitinophagales bacterium]|nr:alpha/beta fold hydrolase [Chitinophagales bacterium]HQO88968.1 alpha/beta fold hydrolase [Chitinophagales bacterium]
MKKTFLYLFALLTVLSCAKENTTENKPIIPPIPSGRTPVIFIHGFLAAGDTYEKQIKRFCSNGYTQADLYTFDWNSLGGTTTQPDLNRMVDEVLAVTGKQKVHLVGHSAGTRVVQDYARNHPDKVQSMVLLAGFPPDRQGAIPILNIYSTFDFIARLGKDVIGGTNVKQTDKDHYEVATCKETFSAMYAFFNDGELPQVLEYTPEEDVILSGRSGSFGENKFLANTAVEIYELDPATGFRKQTAPKAVFSTDAKGNWGPFRASPTAYYEFVVYDKVPDSRKVHYYREPFTRSDKAVYLRTFPTGFSIAGLFLSALPKDDGQCVTAFFGASQAAIAGRDELILDGNILSTNTFCSKENTTIALFAYDDNKNKVSDMRTIGAFNAFPFLKGADIYFPVAPRSSVTMSFNQRVLRATNWKSNSEGVNVMVFE